MGSFLGAAGLLCGCLENIVITGKQRGPGSVMRAATSAQLIGGCGLFLASERLQDCKWQQDFGRQYWSLCFPIETLRITTEKNTWPLMSIGNHLVPSLTSQMDNTGQAGEMAIPHGVVYVTVKTGTNILVLLELRS